MAGPSRLRRGRSAWSRGRRLGRPCVGLADVTIELPTRSNISATTAIGAIAVHGDTGRVVVKSAMGNIAVDRMASGRATTALGDIRVDRVDGDLDVSTASGDVRIGEVQGSATVRTSNGSVTVDHVVGHLQGQGGQRAHRRRAGRPVDGRQDRHRRNPRRLCG